MAQDHTEKDSAAQRAKEAGEMAQRAAVRAAEAAKAAANAANAAREALQAAANAAAAQEDGPVAEATKAAKAAYESARDASGLAVMAELCAKGASSAISDVLKALTAENAAPAAEEPPKKTGPVPDPKHGSECGSSAARPKGAPMAEDDFLKRASSFLREDNALDGVSLGVSANWMVLSSGWSLTEALEDYAVRRRAAEQQRPDLDFHSEEFRYSGNTPQWGSLYFIEPTMLRIPAAREAGVRSENWPHILALCAENRVRVYVEEAGCELRSLIPNEEYCFEIEEYPGSADDAATYGYLKLKICRTGMKE